MAGTVKLRISAAIAPFLRPDCTPSERVKAIGAIGGLTLHDQVVLAFCLSRDTDMVVRTAADTCFASLADAALESYVLSDEAHSAILDAIVRIHHSRPGLAELLAGRPDLSPQAGAFLRQWMERTQVVAMAAPEERGGADTLSEPGEGADETGDCDEVEEEGEEFLSKYKMVQIMGIAEKIKMALSGDKEWRSILIKDSNKLVSSSVIKNPRITESEILSLLKSGAQNDELIRLICANKEWVKNYSIRRALVDNPRTPVQNSLRYLQTLSEKDIAGYAKSKNVSSVVSTQAKRLLLNKKR